MREVYIGPFGRSTEVGKLTPWRIPLTDHKFPDFAPSFIGPYGGKMKLCRTCKLEYSDDTELCARCGSKLGIEIEKTISPRDYEEGY
jgi:hypothetical protein